MQRTQHPCQHTSSTPQPTWSGLPARRMFTPPSLALIFSPRLAQYCSRPRGAAPRPTPATGATSTWLGRPSAASLASLTSLYSAALQLGSITSSSSGLAVEQQGSGWRQGR